MTVCHSTPLNVYIIIWYTDYFDFLMVFGENIKNFIVGVVGNIQDHIDLNVLFHIPDKVIVIAKSLGAGFIIEVFDLENSNRHLLCSFVWGV
jgi:hypothetical protein